MYCAHVLTQRVVGGDIDSLSQSLLNAAVDINPHQIEAALFAFRSPLSKGIILADEVGLGKTIEAGMVICQYWAIAKRKIIICSYNFAARKKDEIRLFGFDLAIIDEAHKLRNVCKKNSVMAHAVRDALYDVKKQLLTATPFQNSLMELYGLTTLICKCVYNRIISTLCAAMLQNISVIPNDYLSYFKRKKTVFSVGNVT